MEPVDRHLLAPDVAFDGGDLDCGSGLLLLIRKHIDPLPRGGLLEIRSTEISVDEDLPAWCRLTGNELLSVVRKGATRSFLVCKGRRDERAESKATLPAPRGVIRPIAAEIVASAPGAPPSNAAVRPSASSMPSLTPLPPLAVTGIGSWPRPRWLNDAIQEHLAGRMEEAVFQSAADDGVRLAVAAQERAAVSLVTDGEQRRDSYASFVGGRLDHCQLVPLTDLLPLVEDPEEFSAELRALDVPAQEVRHPVVFGRLSRSRPIAGHELDFLRTITSRPAKVALPGPYLLSRILWLECLLERAYPSREALAADLVTVLREEALELLWAGAAIVQFDEPVLTEVVFSGPKNRRSFMCGALSERGEPEAELGFARDLLGAVVAGLPAERLAVHVCRGNWTTDEAALLAGDYRPLLGYLRAAPVGTLFLETATPRAGELDALTALPDDKRVGLGLVNPRTPIVDSDEILAGRLDRALALFGKDRLLLNPDCGFATFAANPVASSAVAEAKLAALSRVAATRR